MITYAFYNVYIFLYLNDNYVLNKNNNNLSIK